jgi:hypothetical protein
MRTLITYKSSMGEHIHSAGGGGSGDTRHLCGSAGLGMKEMIGVCVGRGVRLWGERGG